MSAYAKESRWAPASSLQLLACCSAKAAARNQEAHGSCQGAGLASYSHPTDASPLGLQSLDVSRAERVRSLKAVGGRGGATQVTDQLINSRSRGSVVTYLAASESGVQWRM